MAAQYAFICQKAAERPSYLRLTAALHKIRNSKKSADATSQIYSTPRAANLPTARQGQGHCTLFPNSRKIHPEGRFFTGCHIKCTPIEGLGWDFSGFWPLFGLIFGLFWPFFEGQCTQLRLSLSVYQTAAANRASVDGGSLPKMWYILAQSLDPTILSLSSIS